MFTKEEQARTLRIDNLPYWAEEEYLCLCLYIFDSVPQHRRPGDHVKIIKNQRTGQSRGYGFMTFETREAAERIMHLYNGLEVMPGTMEQFCLNWTFLRSKERTPWYKIFRIFRTKKYLNYQNLTPVQLENNKKEVQRSSNLRSSTRCYIPLDLIDDVISRLPAKSVARFRTTCKAWACMTCEPHFTHRHLEKRRSLSEPIVALGEANNNYNTYFFSDYCMETVCTLRTLHFEFPYGFTQSMISYVNKVISNSCNGLVCIHSRHNNNGSASVLNPTIQETIHLPKSFAYLKRGRRYGACSIGLGFDYCSDTYKIVRIFEWDNDFKLGSIKSEYEVFTLGSVTASNQHWRHLGYIPYYVTCYIPPVFVNDAIYWLVCSHHFTGAYTILSVDMRTETSRMISVPQIVMHHSLMELGGYLCILCVDKIDQESNNANLYILEDYVNSRWVKKHSFEPLDTQYLNGIASCDGEIYFTSIWESTLGGYYYHTKSGTFGTMTSSSISSKTLIFSNSLRGCAESLVSPISYLQRNTIPCVILTIFGQRWAIAFPNNPSSSLN